MLKSKKIIFGAFLAMIILSATLCVLLGNEYKGHISKDEAINIASNEFVTLGYIIDDMNIECKINNKNQYTVIFLSKKIQLGGSLEVIIDSRNGEVTNIYHGQ